jgi:hypothetical protein
METNQDYTVENFRGLYGSITVPKGTKLTHQTAMGVDKNYHFVNEYGWIDRDYPTIAKVLKHDVTYYGINVPKEFVTFS